MFEKEASEKANEKYPIPQVWNEIHLARNIKYAEGFQDGAEFGYNKANELHYVKDGDYPKDNKPVLCILGDVDSDNYEVGYYNDVGSGEPWHFETYHLPDDDGDNAWGVSAWKEIVPPKESEQMAKKELKEGLKVIEKVGFKTIPMWKWILLCFCPTHTSYETEGDVACVCFAKVLFHHIYIMREHYYCITTGNLIRTRKLTRKGD